MPFSRDTQNLLVSYADVSLPALYSEWRLLTCSPIEQKSYHPWKGIPESAICAVSAAYQSLLLLPALSLRDKLSYPE